MAVEKDNTSIMFLTLVTSLASTCWQQLGKIPNPLTGKIERNLEGAKISIDILMMLREKTKNNLTPDEDRFLSNTISDLQLNYVDELRKGQEKEEKKENSTTSENQ